MTVPPGALALVELTKIVGTPTIILFTLLLAGIIVGTAVSILLEEEEE